MNILLNNWYPVSIPIAVILWALLIFSIIKLRGNRALAEKLCFYILGFVLIYKTFHYVIYCVLLKHSWNEQIPAEISQLAYFLCPLAFFSRNKWLRDGGAFTGIIAGFAQLASISIAPYRFAEAGICAFSFFESTLMHYCVFWGGMVQICCVERMELKNIWRNYLVFGAVLLWGILASYTWMFGTDAAHPHEPANIGFIIRCDYLPDAILDAAPWMLEHHLYLIPYFAIFFLVTGILYGLSYLCFKGIKPQEPSMYGLGFKGFRDFMRTNSVKEAEKN